MIAWNDFVSVGEQSMIHFQASGSTSLYLNDQRCGIIVWMIIVRSGTAGWQLYLTHNSNWIWFESSPLKQLYASSFWTRELLLVQLHFMQLPPRRFNRQQTLTSISQKKHYPCYIIAQTNVLGFSFFRIKQDLNGKSPTTKNPQTLFAIKN